MAGSGWCVHELNALAMKKRRMNLSKSGICFAVGGNGILVGMSGGGQRFRQPHFAWVLCVINAALLTVE